MSCNKKQKVEILKFILHVIYNSCLPSYQNEEDSSSSRNYAGMARSSLETQHPHIPAGSFQQKVVTLVPAESYVVSSCGFHNQGSAQTTNG